MLHTCPANVRLFYSVTLSLIGWAHSQNDSCRGGPTQIASDWHRIAFTPQIQYIIIMSLLHQNNMMFWCDNDTVAMLCIHWEALHCVMAHLTHWSLKMANILQMASSNAHPWKSIFEFQSKLHENVFLRVHLMMVNIGWNNGLVPVPSAYEPLPQQELTNIYTAVCLAITGPQWFNSLAPVRFEWDFRWLIFKLTLMISDWGVSCEIALWCMPLDLTDDKSTLVQVMAWCHQATSHYLNQCWPRSLPPYGVTRPQRVKSVFITKTQKQQSYISTHKQVKALICFLTMQQCVPA